MTKTRQLELAIEELAAGLAKPGAKESGRVWMGWVRAGNFGYRLDQWEALAEKTGKALAQAGWPEKSSEAMDEFLAWARPRRGKNMSDFYEGRFLRDALLAGVKSAGESVEALRWAARMESERVAFVATLPKRSLTDRERQASFGPSFRLPESSQAERSVESWRQMAAEAPWAREALFSAAARGFEAAAADCGGGSLKAMAAEGLLRAMAETLTPEQAQSAMREAFGGWRVNEERQKARARVAQELCARGASWLVAIPSPRTGRPMSAIDQIQEDHNPFAARAAREDLGEEAFWAAFKSSAREWLKSPDKGARMCGWLPLMGDVDPEAARMALRAASLATQTREPELIREAFAAAGSLAELKGASPWLFPGFAEADEPSFYGSSRKAKAPLDERAETEPKAWLMANRRAAYELSSQGAQSALGALMEELARHGVEPPWGGEAPEADPGARAMFEGWSLNVAAGGAREAKKGPPRV